MRAEELEAKLAALNVQEQTTLRALLHAKSARLDASLALAAARRATRPHLTNVGNPEVLARTAAGAAVAFVAAETAVNDAFREHGALARERGGLLREPAKLANEVN